MPAAPKKILKKKVTKKVTKATTPPAKKVETPKVETPKVETSKPTDIVAPVDTVSNYADEFTHLLGQLRTLQTTLKELTVYTQKLEKRVAKKSKLVPSLCSTTLSASIVSFSNMSNLSFNISNVFLLV